MTEPTPDEIRELVRQTQHLLGLNEWEITVHVQEVNDDISPDKRLSGASVAYPEYKAADVYFDPAQIVFSKSKLTDLVRHELIHVVVSPIIRITELWAGDDPTREEFVRYVHEQVATHLERMPLWDALETRDV